MDFLDRIGRPLSRLASTFLMLGVTYFFFVFANAAAAGLNRWARGEPVDMQGLAAVLTAASALLGILMVHIVSLFRDRRIERVEQIRAGGSAAPPFPSPAPSAPPSPPQQNPDPSFQDGGLVNNQAIQ